MYFLKHNSVADPGFPPGGGRQLPKWVCELHENERILAPGGASLAPPP